jgi:hypothetical protein
MPLRLPRILVAVAIGLTLTVVSRTCTADRFVSVDMGYFSTTSSQYKSGFTYGVGLTEGEGKFGFGIAALRFGNTCTGQMTTLLDGKPYTTEFEEEVTDFVLTIMGTYRFSSSEDKNRLMLGAGPQVHFVNSRRSFSTFSESARDFRLGAGALVSYHRRLDMFGTLAFVATASYSHMQSVESRTDLYDVPTSAMNITTITGGLAFPF